MAQADAEICDEAGKNGLVSISKYDSSKNL